VAARRAAARRTERAFVRAARSADRLRAAADRRRDTVLAWRASAFREAADRPSRFSASEIARDRFADTARRRWRPARDAAAALRRVVDLALAGGAPSSTPARRAFDNPMAIACFVERAPCFP